MRGKIGITDSVRFHSRRDPVNSQGRQKQVQSTAPHWSSGVYTCRTAVVVQIGLRERAGAFLPPAMMPMVLVAILVMIEVVVTPVPANASCKKYMMSGLDK